MPLGEILLSANDYTFIILRMQVKLVRENNPLPQEEIVVFLANKLLSKR